MIKLIDILNEIRVNNPNWVNFEATIDDDDDEIKVLIMSHGDKAWHGHWGYKNNPEYVNFEFGVDEEEQEKELTNLLEKFGKPYKLIPVDDEFHWIQITKSLVNTYQ